MRQSVWLDCIASAGAMLDVLFMKGLVECIAFFETEAGLWHGFFTGSSSTFWGDVAASCLGGHLWCYWITL